MENFVATFERYEENREQMRAWFLRHYVARFALEPCTVLDVGCGHGFWVGLFREAGFDAMGIDVDRDFVAAAMRKHPDVPFWVADITRPIVPHALHFELGFMRTMPQMYGEQVDTAALANVLAVCDRLLVSVYTDESGLLRDYAWHHRRETLEAGICAAGGRVLDWDRQAGYVTFLVAA